MRRKLFALTVIEAPSITSADATTFTVGAAGTFTVTTAHDFPLATTLSMGWCLAGRRDVRGQRDWDGDVGGYAGGRVPVAPIR